MNALKAMLVIALLRLCSLLPLACARGLGRGAARLYWPFRGRSRRVTEKNIQLAFPGLTPGQQERLARRSISATAEQAAEMGHLWLRSPDYVLGLVQEVHGAVLISTALAAGRGVIVLAPHLGNWEVVGPHLSTLGETVCLYEPPRLERLGSLIERARQRSGVSVVPTDTRGLARLVKNVKRGNITGILPDQVPAALNAGENAPFMGISCFTGTLSSNMIRRTGALAVFGVARRVPGGFTLRYEAVEDTIYDADTPTSLAALNRGVEHCLRQCPEQYQWEYKRFRVRPKVRPGVYDKL